MSYLLTNVRLAVNNNTFADYDVLRSLSRVYRYKYRFRYSHYLVNDLRRWVNGKYIIRGRY